MALFAFAFQRHVLVSVLSIVLLSLALGPVVADEMPKCQNCRGWEESVAMQMAPMLQQHGERIVHDHRRWPSFDDFEDAASSALGNLSTSVLEPAMETLQLQFNSTVIALMDKAKKLQHVAANAKQGIPAKVARSADKAGAFVNASKATLEAVLVPWKGIIQILQNMSDSAMEAVHRFGQPHLVKDVFALFEPTIVAAEGVSQSIASCERKLDEFPQHRFTQGNSSLLVIDNQTAEPQQPIVDPLARIRESRDSFTTFVNTTAFVAESLEQGIANMSRKVEEFWPIELFNITPYFETVEEAVHTVFEVIEDSFADILQGFTDSLSESFTIARSPCALVFFGTFLGFLLLSE